VLSRRSITLRWNRDSYTSDSLLNSRVPAAPACKKAIFRLAAVHHPWWKGIYLHVHFIYTMRITLKGVT
jgi:hypothetical protein